MSAQEEDVSKKEEELKCLQCGKFPCACPKKGGGSVKKTGKINLLCGTSTAGKTSICHALQEITGHNWFINGADLAYVKAWNEPSTNAMGQTFSPASQHFTDAMKKYADADLVERAKTAFEPITLSVAILSRQTSSEGKEGEGEKTTLALGNPKIDTVTIYPDEDITKQYERIHRGLSPENQAKYTPDNIKDLLEIIKKCPDPLVFQAQHPHPIQHLSEQMLDDAIMRAKEGESVILDIVGNEKLQEDSSMLEQFHQKIAEAGLPSNTGSIEVVHCPVVTLLERMDQRNRKAEKEGKPEEIRKSFFPYIQYSDIYDRAPSEQDPERPVVGRIDRKDIVAAAEKFAKKEDAAPLLKTLGFTEQDESIEIVTRMKCDKLSHNIEPQDTETIAYDICKRAFPLEYIETAIGKIVGMSEEEASDAKRTQQDNPQYIKCAPGTLFLREDAADRLLNILEKVQTPDDLERFRTTLNMVISKMTEGRSTGHIFDEDDEIVPMTLEKELIQAQLAPVNDALLKKEKEFSQASPEESLDNQCDIGLPVNK